MSWNYRIIRHRSARGVWYGLHEVYYRKNGKAYLWNPEPEITAETKADLVGSLAMMLRDATKGAPVLKPSEMPGYKRKK